MRFFRVNLAVLILAAASVPAFAQFAGVQVIATNTVIDQPGSYVLGHNLNASPSLPGITITASGVVVDLNGYQINGQGNNTGIGIQIMGATGVQVFNGGLSNLGFGVVVSGSSNVTLRNLNIKALGLAVAAPPPETGIMIVESRGVVVDSNNLYSVGLGIFVRGGMSHGNRITNNNITAGSNAALGICYNPAPNDPVGPSGDLVANNSIYGFPTGISVNATAGVNVFRENTIFHTASGLNANGSPVQDLNNTFVLLK